MSEAETIEFNGIIYRRYPNSKYNRHKRFHDDKGHALHRAIWIFHNGPIPSGHHIHHKDCDPLNNSIENLDCLTARQHCRAHSDLAKLDPSKDIYESRRMWQRSQEGFEHHSELSKLNWSNRKKELLPCKICGDICERYADFSKKIVCDLCQAKRQSVKQKENYVPKQRITSEVKCEVCGSICIQKTRKEKRFCSRVCKSNARYHEGTDNIARKCTICNKEFLINRHCKTQTCSDSCRGKYISRRMLPGG